MTIIIATFNKYYSNRRNMNDIIIASFNKRIIIGWPQRVYHNGVDNVRTQCSFNAPSIPG